MSQSPGHRGADSTLCVAWCLFSDLLCCPQAAPVALWLVKPVNIPPTFLNAGQGAISGRLVGRERLTSRSDIPTTFLIAGQGARAGGQETCGARRRSTILGIVFVQTVQVWWYYSSLSQLIWSISSPFSFTHVHGRLRTCETTRGLLIQSSGSWRSLARSCKWGVRMMEGLEVVLIVDMSSSFSSSSSGRWGVRIMEGFEVVLIVDVSSSFSSSSSSSGDDFSLIHHRRLNWSLFTSLMTLDHGRWWFSFNKRVW